MEEDCGGGKGLTKGCGAKGGGGGGKEEEEEEEEDIFKYNQIYSMKHYLYTYIIIIITHHGLNHTKSLIKCVE
jgi:hypothetical protein